MNPEAERWLKRWDNGHKVVIRCHEITLKSIHAWLTERHLSTVSMSTLVGSPINCHTWAFDTEAQAEDFAKAWSEQDMPCFCHERGKIYKVR